VATEDTAAVSFWAVGASHGQWEGPAELAADNF